MPERLGSLADTDPAVAPRMLSGQWQDLLDPALRKRLEQQIGVPIDPDAIRELICEVGEGTVHRLWEPLADKQRPANGYGGKFSTPYCIAAAFVRGNVGLGDFTDAAVKDPAVRAVAAKVRYVVDPDNPYPNNFTGHIRAVLRDGSVIEERQPHMRGGAHEPLSPQDIADKFALCARHGGFAGLEFCFPMFSRIAGGVHLRQICAEYIYSVTADESENRRAHQE